MNSDENTKFKKKIKRHPKSGRPKAIIDWEKVSQLIMGGCNATQVAARLGIDRDTLYNRCQTDLFMDFSAYFQEKRESGNVNIHLAQYELAVKNKNATMLIWLGKQRCDQKEDEKKTEFTQDQLEQFATIMKFLDKNQSPASALNSAESNKSNEEKS